MNISDSFNEYFEIIKADTTELKNKTYQLRFQVYSLERNIPDFDPSKYPDKLEIDEYDEHSIHVLLVHKQSGEAAGTARLIYLNPNDPHSHFQIEPSFRPEYGFKIPDEIRNKTAEVSRFILSSKFRSRFGESQIPSGLVSTQSITNSPNNDRRSTTHPIYGLIKAMIEYSWYNNIGFLLAGMEPSLHRVLKQLGIVLNQVSPEIQYGHLHVNVYFRSIPELMYQCHNKNKPLWDFLTNNGEIWPIA
jgi:N-acyl amino acid synthase of PEP-CTERM/exosortase system